MKLDEKMGWNPPVLPEIIPHGDMPGDRITIGEEHIMKANMLFPKVLEEITKYLEGNEYTRVVVSICGGSGVGKSEIASLLSYYFEQLNIHSYILSGDNYPYRIPGYNDAERLRIFREQGMKGMMQQGVYNQDSLRVLHGLQQQEEDANRKYTDIYPWFPIYLEAGCRGLKEYLGTPDEINFDEINAVISQFKDNQDDIWIRRMGRESTELWYEKVSFQYTQLLIVEWTHGNSEYCKGIDVPVLLNSTPQETLEHRRTRNRDRNIDSPFTMRVLEREQQMLQEQADKAKIILSRQGELLEYQKYFNDLKEEDQK